MMLQEAIAPLAAFGKAKIVVEVTHRSKRRLFGLAGLAALRDQVASLRRPEPGRGPGRPPAIREDRALPPANARSAADAERAQGHRSQRPGANLIVARRAMSR